MDKPTIILLDESLAESIGKDIATLMMFLVMLGIGVALGSVPMQWMGAVFWFFWLCLVARGRAARHRMTVLQASAKLDEVERRASR